MHRAVSLLKTAGFFKNLLCCHENLIANWFFDRLVRPMGKSMIIHKVTISKEQLSLFPEKERVLFIQIGHLANELTTLGIPGTEEFRGQYT